MDDESTIQRYSEFQSSLMHDVNEADDVQTIYNNTLMNGETKFEKCLNLLQRVNSELDDFPVIKVKEAQIKRRP